MTIRLRSFDDSDIEILDDLWQQYWQPQGHGLPNRRNSIIDSVVIDVSDNDHIIGYGQVKVFAEAMLFLDPTVRKRDRAQATKLLMFEAFRGASDVGIEEIYCFIRDPLFAQFIAKRYGFESIPKPGELLLRKV